MGLININKEKPIIIVGKNGTGKTTKALKLLTQPKVMYADDVDFDMFSFPSSNGLLIKDLHYKADTKTILNIIRNYRGKIVFTSINQKSIPKQIKAMCKIKRADKTNYRREEIKQIAPRSEEPSSHERDTFSLVQEYLKNGNRNAVMEMLKFNKPSDIQLLSWLDMNIHPNKIMFVDRVVKRRWNQNYFYELLSFAHDGKYYGRLNMPKRQSYSPLPKIAKRVKVKDYRIFKQLLNDEDFVEYVATKTNNAEYRLLGIGEKKKPRKKNKKVINQKTLGEFL